MAVEITSDHDGDGIPDCGFRYGNNPEAPNGNWGFECVPAAAPPGGTGDPCISPNLLVGEMPETNEYLSTRRKRIRGRRRKRK